jgi:hypothetical protein
MHGVEPSRGGEVRPGKFAFEGSNHGTRRRAELLHNAALEGGYESELVRLKSPPSWTVNIRSAGSKTPPFIDDRDFPSPDFEQP